MNKKNNVSDPFKIVMSSESKDIKETCTCNMCHEEFEYHVDQYFRGKTINVCVNPKCPNYALLQISAEKMPK